MDYLERFNISSSTQAPAVHTILSALLTARALTLGELQTARDIITRCPAASAPDIEPYAYLFIAALFLSEHLGNTFLRANKALPLLQSTLYDVPNLSLDDALWSRATVAAEKLEGDIIIRKPSPQGDGWFFQKNFAAVEAVQKALQKLETSAIPKFGESLSAAELEAARKIGEGQFLNDEQMTAVQTVVTHRFAVVTGGPGTGKTTIVRAFLRILRNRGLNPERIALVAPTGRAAQRMGESIHGIEKLDALSGCTIHSLLGGHPPHWKHTTENKLPHELIVVDEASMVDIHLMNALLAALSSTCRLVLLGDKDQLPSVEIGAVLGDIVSHRSGESVVHLKESKRFTGSLAKCAAAINQGDVATFESNSTDLATQPKNWLAHFASPNTKNQCFRYVLPPSPRPADCRALLKEWTAQSGLLEKGLVVRLASDPKLVTDLISSDGQETQKANDLFSALNSFRILTVVHEGPYGNETINEFLARLRLGGRAANNPLSRPGVPIMITSNTPSRNLWNGDIGVTVQGESGIVAIFRRGKKYILCPAGLLPPHELAYAITVHKSQGSEFQNVLLLLPADEKNPLLSRPLVYTGVTRAKDRALVMTTQASLKQALTTQLIRNTSL